LTKNLSTARAFAVIPARAGSSRLPGKNFRETPRGSLVEIAIQTCKEAAIFTEIFLTTDASRGKELAAREGIRFHSRSPAAASSSASATDVLLDLTETLEAVGVTGSDYVFYLQPTSPLRTPEMLTHAWRILWESAAPGAATVFPLNRKYAKLLKVSESTIEPVFGSRIATANQQELDPLFLANGNLFAFRWDVFLAAQEFPLAGLEAIVQSEAQSLDIDDYEEFETFLKSV
jgi:CMP-N,N'-diacetyllegionaminic acid synthase